MKSFFNVIKVFFSGYFSFIASAASILGLVIVFVPNKNHSLIALIAFSIFLLLILIRIFYVTKIFLLQKTNRGEHRFATYVKYSTTDGEHISIEIQKYIQCKTFSIGEHQHEFHWTGTSLPLVSSTQQEFIGITKALNENDYDKATFRFKSPLMYNEFSIVEINMDIDDSDKASRHFYNIKVQENIQLLSYRIELKHLDHGNDAKVLRKPIHAQFEKEFEIIGYVPFDVHSKSYSYNLYKPSIGYNYKLSWE